MFIRLFIFFLGCLLLFCFVCFFFILFFSWIVAKSNLLRNNQKEKKTVKIIILAYIEVIRHGILSCFVGSLKIVINWREPLTDSLPV